MKKNRAVHKATAPTEPIQTNLLSGGQENRLPTEPDLSPERIMAGVSSSTVVLSQILAQREGRHQLRDWGINE